MYIHIKQNLNYSSRIRVILVYKEQKHAYYDTNSIENIKETDYSEFDCYQIGTGQ